MMKDNIFSICLGNNSKDLKGCKNDSLLFFEYLSSLHQNKNLKENWIKPNILLDEEVAVNNIQKLLLESKESFNKLLLFYSGHGSYKNKLNIYSKDRTKKNINSSQLIRDINDVLKNNISLYIVLDSCYSGSFEIVPYEKIKNIKLIASTLENQKSTESVIKKTNISKIFNDKFDKDEITLGTFTYHFVNLLNKLNINCIDDFKLVFYNKDYTNIWICIGIIGKHFPKIIW